MNSIIKNQLLKVRSADLKFDDDAESIIIPKTDFTNKRLLNVGDLCVIMYDNNMYYVEICSISGEDVKINGVLIECGTITTKNISTTIKLNDFSILNKE